MPSAESELSCVSLRILDVSVSFCCRVLRWAIAPGSMECRSTLMETSEEATVDTADSEAVVRRGGDGDGRSRSSPTYGHLAGPGRESGFGWGTRRETSAGRGVPHDDDSSVLEGGDTRRRSLSPSLGSGHAKCHMRCDG